jgi:lambda family phage portal protein
MGKPTLNLLEKVISYVSPTMALERGHARQMLTQFGYDGVSGDGRRGTSGGTPGRNGSPENPRMSLDVVKLMWESRDLERNSPLWNGVLSRTTRYSLGTIKWQSRTGDSALDAEYEAYFENWQKNCDYKGQHDFTKLCQLYLRSMLRDGDVGVHFVDEGGELKLQGIEADRIGDPNQAGNQGNNEVRGVKLGEHGEVTGYKIYKRNRNNQYDFDQEVVPSDFVLLMDAERIDQTRGICWAGGALTVPRDLKELDQSEMDAAKFAASFAGFLKSNNPYSSKSGSAWDGKGADGVNKMEMKSGIIQRLPEGDDIVFQNPPNRPNGAYMAYYENKIREFSVKLDMPFGFIWNLAMLGGVTARIEVNQVMRTLKHFRELMRRKLLEEVVVRVLRRGVANKDIRQHPKRGAGKWNFGAEITGDVGHDTSADLQLLEVGAISLSDLVEGKLGGDFEELCKSQAREMTIRQEVAAESGVPIELQSERFPNATQLLAAMQTRGEPDAEQPVLDENAPEQMPMDSPAPPAGLAAAHGKDAVKGLLDIMKKLNTGELTREQAVTVLVASYGMDLAEAEQIIPNQ